MEAIDRLGSSVAPNGYQVFLSQVPARPHAERRNANGSILEILYSAEPLYACIVRGGYCGRCRSEEPTKPVLRTPFHGSVDGLRAGSFCRDARSPVSST